MRMIIKSVICEIRRLWSRKFYKTLFGALISLFVLVFLLFYASKNIKELQQVWNYINIEILLFTFPVFILAVLLGGYLWSSEVHKFGVTFSNGFNIRIYLLTLAARRIPGPFMHIVSRVALYKKNGVSAITLSFVSGLDLALTIWSGILVALSSLFFYKSIQFSNVLLLVFFLFLLTILLHPKVIRFLFKKIAREQSVYEIDYKTILVWLLGYVILWALGASILFITITAIYPIKSSMWLLALTAWSISGVSGTLMTFLPSGLGLTEVAMSLILGQFMPSSIAVIVAIVFRVLLTLFDFIISIIFWGYERLNTTNGLLN